MCDSPCDPCEGGDAPAPAPVPECCPEGAVGEKEVTAAAAPVCGGGDETSAAPVTAGAATVVPEGGAAPADMAPVVALEVAVPAAAAAEATPPCGSPGK